MKRFAEWIQFAGAVGVLVGILLVLLQLQQNEQLLRFQIATDLRINRDSDRNVTRGEEYSTTLAKLQLAPLDLTDVELVEFNAHAASLFHELTLRRLLLEHGIFEGDWKDWLVSETCEVLGNPIGRQWLAFHDTGASDIVREELKRRVDECGPTFLQTIRSERIQGRVPSGTGKVPAPASDRPAQRGDGDPAFRRKPDEGSTAMD